MFCTHFAGRQDLQAITDVEVSVMGGTAIGWFISWKMHENPITMDDLKLPPI